MSLMIKDSCGGVLVNGNTYSIPFKERCAGMAHVWYSARPGGIRQGQGASLPTGSVWGFPACKK